ncbi:hypothetical protein DL98DRAFT_517004 [Cadophora sp. DSE1049]|nr:hypothetical protein DL98DRAFT_517004 [Cadophora sp. DSE1049]
MPRRHGKRRYGPGGQYVQPTTATKNVPKISKTKQRRREKIDNRVWRDQTPMPKRVKNTMSNEERSLATKARKAENKKTREEKEARKSKVMEDLKGMMAQTKTFQGAADGGLAALKNKVSKDMRGLM